MYNKPAPFNIGSPEQLAESVGYSKQALAKIMQNPNSGVDPTLAVLAGMYVDRIKSGGQLTQPPTTTVKDDVLAGLEQASIPEDMFSSAPGEAPTQTYAGGGLVAFADGGEVDDPNWYEADAYGDPTMPMAARRAGLRIKFPDASEAEIDRYLVKAEKARASRQQGGLGSLGQNALKLVNTPRKPAVDMKYITDPQAEAAAKREAAGLEEITPFQRDIKNADAAILSGVDKMLSPVQGAFGAVERGLAGIPDYFMSPQGKAERAAKAAKAAQAGMPQVNMNDLPLPGKPTITLDDLPPISARGGGGGGASGSASYTPGGKPLGLNTDLKKEVEGLDKIYNEIFPETAEEKKNKEYYSDEAVNTRAGQQKKQDLWEALLHLGFNAAANDSPYWTQAWGEAGKAMAPHVSAMLKARKDEKEAVQKARQAMAQATRAKNDDTFKLASKNVSDARELEARARLEQERIKASFAETRMRIAAANKPSRDEKYVDYLAKQMIADGMDPTQAYAKASREVMRYTSGIEKYEQTQTKMTKDQATKAWTKDISYDREYRRIKKAEGQAAADAYKAGVINSLMNGGSDDMDTTASDGAPRFKFLGKE